MLRLERDAWSTVLWLRQATIEYPDPPPPLPFLRLPLASPSPPFPVSLFHPFELKKSCGCVHLNSSWTQEELSTYYIYASWSGLALFDFS